jgi:hypothetical protein
LERRYKLKDTYDIYYCIRTTLMDQTRSPKHAVHCSNMQVVRRVTASLLASSIPPYGFGPACVRHFVEYTHVLGDCSPEQWQQDAFVQVDAWLRALGLRV